MSLFEKYEQVQEETREISYSYFFSCLSEPIKFIDLDEFSVDEVVNSYKDKLKIMLREKDFGLTPNLINEFSQKLGEVHFYCLCLEKKITLSKIEETQTESTPDFSYIDGENTFYFEVKTPSVIGGDSAINDDIETGCKLKHFLSCNQSERHCSATVEHMPYGKRIKEYGHTRGVIKTLSDKITQNYKSTQFTKKNTFMVLNLSMIHHLITEPEELNPVYSLRRDANKIVSGAFWMMAFRKIGMAVFSNPSKDCNYGLDGYCEKNGVLADYDEIEGILLITNPPLVKSEIWGLFRERTLKKPSDMETLLKFTNYKYNDEINTRGQCNNKNNKSYAHNSQ